MSYDGSRSFQSAIRKYQERGWEIQHIFEAHRNAEILRTRTLRDRNSWVIPLAPLPGNPWPNRPEVGDPCEVTSWTIASRISRESNTLISYSTWISSLLKYAYLMDRRNFRRLVRHITLTGEFIDDQLIAQALLSM